ncbi:hypothetical protein ILUMI_10618 [Ignelater luminosus]|uniref:Phosphatidylethanolamine-binding protein n=1 Tax=Ignelater luminosus TaxID=2038154 RepID=A0A8K0CXS8_IGNLU|nr:hypothetical protein ILUMI_10618 [Ignelater luminosus]
MFKENNRVVDLGNELPPRHMKDEPHISYEADPDEYYTLIMIDPDAPRRKNPIQKEWQAWLVVNIPGSRVKDGETLTEYIPPCPVNFTGFHRFVFLVYQQPNRLDFNEPYKSNTDVTNRINFSTKRFARKYGLGDPIAGNFFQAEYDESVPECLRKAMFPGK